MMQAKPKTYAYSGAAMTVPLPAGAGLWIQCEITHPPSQVGRSVDVYLDQEMVTELLLRLRDSAREARQGRTERDVREERRRHDRGRPPGPWRPDRNEGPQA